MQLKNSYPKYILSFEGFITLNRFKIHNLYIKHLDILTNKAHILYNYLIPSYEFNVKKIKWLKV